MPAIKFEGCHNDTSDALNTEPELITTAAIPPVTCVFHVLTAATL